MNARFIPILLALLALAAYAPGAERPALVVVIVIDQFPGHLLELERDRLSARGLRLLMDGGAWYTDARYPQAATLTGVGHATIATGALPAGHGIPGNEWYDFETDRQVYCVEDADHHWVGGKEKPGDGTSPRTLETTTFSDEWLIATHSRAKAVALSLKDRSSILLGGRLGKAYWYDEKTGLFVSSTYYASGGRLPDWIEAFNAPRPANRLFRARWELLLPADPGITAPDDRPFEIDVKGLGRVFPHVLGQGLEAPGPDFYKALLHVPQGNQLLLDAALAAIDGEKLGQRGTTDILLLSITANDYCGHVFGPESLEFHDMTLRTDRQLEAFFSQLDSRIGLEKCLLVLTSDHGAMASPEHLEAAGLPSGRVDPDALAQAADEALDRRFGPEEWIAKFVNPGLFIRREPLARRQASLAEAERIAAGAASRVTGIAGAFARSDLAAGRFPPTLIGRAAAASFHPQRGPDVLVVQRPHWYLYKEMKKYEGMHASPYGYDTHVPIIFHGTGIAPGRHPRRVTPADIAPTLSYLLGLQPPPSSEGEVLEEVVNERPPASMALSPPGAGHLAVRPRDLTLFTLPDLPVLAGPEGKPVQLQVTVEAAGGPLLESPRLVPVVEGGFSGLALACERGREGENGLEFWMVTDRGPNLAIEARRDAEGRAFGKGAKLFPAPWYQQAVLKLRIEPGRTARITEREPLRVRGKPLRGLPSSAPGRASAETAFSRLDDASASARIAPSEAGFDLEGLHVEEGAEGRRFWTCDEYGPSIQVFDAEGNLIRDFLPGATPSGAGSPDDPAIAPLPSVLKERRNNRGFEGLAGTKDHVFAAVQSTLDPESLDPSGRDRGAEGRIHRIVRVNKRTGEAAQFGYDHIDDPAAFGTTHAEVKIGDLVAVDDSGQDFLVFEYAAGAYARLYRVLITAETTRLDDARGLAYEAGRLPYRALEKRLAADLSGALETLPIPAKIEGMALAGSSILYLVLDNDYGFASDGSEVYQLPDLERRALLLRMTLPR